MAVFRFFKMAAVRHIGFLKIRNLTAGPIWRPNVRHRVKFCAYLSIRSGYIAVFQLYNMAADRHLGFVLRVFGPPASRIWWSLVSICKFCANRSRRCGDGRFRSFKMAAVRHLGFVIRLLGLPTKCILVVSVIVQNLVWIGSVVSIIY